ncbi:sensor histidine kinase [Vannielia litorea]|uniref:histidine kinase n=1 Tax=Vannielia litorea TaxID=1217970 RepID=A0A1N6GVR8_9RHOB|nr:sensor histidine kinase [Vannielia litorea]SIO11618.1 two-component system, OmpR family, sensor histidine kinase TctE [Vannielia litorea]
MSAGSWSLRARLLLLILCPLLVVGSALGFWRFQSAQSTAQELFDRGLLATALAIARDVTISEGDALSPRTRDLISDAGGGEVFYHVTGPGGYYVTGYAYPPSVGVRPSGDDLHYLVAEYRGEPVRVLRLTETTTLGNLTGETIVTVWQRVADRQRFAHALAWRAAAVITALLATLVVVVWFGVNIGLRPLANLRAAIERRSPDDLSRIQRAVPVEVSGIVSTLNRLLGQVENDIKAHQAFISDAAHQLRNPASGILSLAETMPAVTDPSERAAHEQKLIAAARKSARLAERLLSLERLRYSTATAQEAFDLSDCAAAACGDIASQALARDIEFTFERCREPLPVIADQTLVAEAIGNLVDNALTHGGSGLRMVRVSTRTDGAVAEVEVEDDGAGLPAGADAVVFRRFSQLDGGKGSGLGLSIVQEVARAHGGEAALRSRTGGATFVLSFPLARPGSPAAPAQSG